jgi:hypothetical protein
MNVYTKYILTKCEEIKRLSCEITNLVSNNVDENNRISKGFLIKYIDDISENIRFFMI